MTEPWPRADLEPVPACPVCGSESREKIYDELEDCVFKVAPGKWSLQRCMTCNSGYLDPRPTRETIGRAYATYFTHVDTDHPIVRRIGRIRSLLHDAINGYQNRRHGSARSPSAPLLGRFLFLAPSLWAAARSECRHLPRPGITGRKVLDVGCGNGGFLMIAQQAGWMVEGVDPDDAAVEACRKRGLNVHAGSAEDLRTQSAAYDLITLSHVIEHVHDPVALLRKLAALLKPDGQLWIDTPNLQSLGAQRFGRNWRDLDPPRHLVLFTPSSLRQALRAAGFSHMRQHWRGMTVFEVFAASQAIAMEGGIENASYQGKPPLSAIVDELQEMIRPSRREFLTFTARI